MKAMFYDLVSDDKIICNVCAHHCLIPEGKKGLCGVRKNINKELIVLNYRKTIATSIDPIEKKPIYEYLENTSTYSFATVGCNMDCPWCQNKSISQASKKDADLEGYDISPEIHVQQAINMGCPSISYTYSEPTIFLEYAFDTMKIAKRNGIKNIWVSNGYMSTETLDLILPFLDAINIDYKGTKEVYQKYLNSNNQIVLDNLKKIKENKVHLEVTTLLIPGVNDSTKQIKRIIKDLINAIGTEFVWHLSRFYPHYKMKNKPITKIETLKKAKKLGEKAGIKSIYLGNV